MSKFGELKIIYDAIVTVISTNNEVAKAKVLIINDNKKISLNDCLQAIDYKENEICKVIVDKKNKGVIYEYGYCGNKKWREYGVTKGYK